MNFKECWNVGRESNGKAQVMSTLIPYQKASNIFLYFFLKLEISATNVSLIMSLISVVGLLLMLFGTKTSIIWGISCFLLAMVLDHTDGDVARATGKGSMFGHFFDNIHHTSEDICIFLGLGIYATVFYNHTLFLILGVGISFLILLMGRFKYYMIGNFGIKPRDDLMFRKFPWVLFYGDWFKIWYWVVLFSVIFNFADWVLFLVILWAVVRIPVILCQYAKACYDYDNGKF